MSFFKPADEFKNQYLCRPDLEPVPERLRTICCLCGSSKYKDEFMRLAAELTKEGKIVVMPHIFCHSDKIELSKELKDQLDMLHLNKISLAHEVHIVHSDYIGFSTMKEIEYAKKMYKRVIYHGDHNFSFNPENTKKIRRPKNDNSN